MCENQTRKESRASHHRYESLIALGQGETSPSGSFGLLRTSDSSENAVKYNIMKHTRGQKCAVFFSVIMVLSMIALSVSFAGTAVAFTGDGNGTEPDDPYQITDWEELYDVRDKPGAYYELQNDLDNSTNGYDTYNADDSAGWDPIGDDSTKFTGSFDGQGYTIDGLYIDRADVTLNGLFGYIGTDGEVRNLGVTNVNLTGQNQMGGLAGKNDGLIDNSFATGVVDGGERTGGLVGHNEGEGTITNSYSGVEVISDDGMIGGLVGDNSNAEIKKSYSFGVVDEADTGSTVGGLTGREDGGGATNVDSFWDTETSGQTSSGGGTGKTTAEMQDVATFTDESTDGLNSAWDFVDDPNDDTGTEDIWGIDASINEEYPYLVPYEHQFSLNSPADSSTGVSTPPELNVMVSSPESDDSDVEFYERTGWDISTAEDTGITAGTEDTGPEGIHFSPDGETMYVMGYSDEKVYQFSLTTPWDIDTAKLEHSQKNVDPNSADLFVSPDGENYYELEKADGEIHWMDMDGGNISTVNTGDIKATIATQSSDPEDIHFSPDGTKLYELSNSDIYEYDLSTAWDISTATYSEVSISSQDSSSTGLFFHPSGEELYEIGDGDDQLHQFSLGTAWDLSTASADDVSVSVAQGDAHGLFFKSDGTELYFVSRDGETVHQYSLDTSGELINAVSNVESGTDVTHTWDGLDTYRYYEWFVTANDGSTSTTSDTWSFTTTETPSVDSINVTTQPNTLTYDSGDSLDLTGMEVTETYSGGTTETVTFTGGTHADYTADPSDGDTLNESHNETNVTVTHTDSGKTTDTDTLTVNTVVESIVVETQPDTLTYDSDDALNLSGLVINETLTNETTQTTAFDDADWSDDYSANPSNGTELNESDDGTNVTVTHTDSGKTTDTDMLTVNTVVDSISVETQPDTLDYDSGDALDLTGLVINETLSDGTTDTTAFGDADWSEYTADPSDETTLEGSDDGSPVTVTHTDSGNTADTDPLTVNTVVESISVETQPNLTYDSGESLNLSGIEVTETYSDGSTLTVTYGDSDWDSDYSVDPSDGTVLEEGDDGSTVTVTHTDSGETADTDTLTVNTDDDGSDGADSIAIQTEPDGTQTAGETLTGPPKVNVTDEHGNAVEGVDVTVTENSDYSFDSGTTTQTTGNDGVATFEDLVIETAGTSYELNFSISSGDHNVTAGDTASSQTVEVESATADAITIQTQPDVTQTANETLTGLPAVNVTDEHGNAVEGTNVTVALMKPEGGPQDFGHNSTLTVLTNESGIATFDNLVVNTTTGDYRLEFTVNPSVTSELFSMEAATDTTPPEITNFIINNTEGQTVEVSFDSDKELSKINSNGTDDADGTNLVMSNFTQSGNLTSGFTYIATLSENEDGTFGATLDTAKDANDSDGASDESDSVMIDTSTDGDGSSSGSSDDDDGGNGDDGDSGDGDDNGSNSESGDDSDDGSDDGDGGDDGDNDGSSGGSGDSGEDSDDGSDDGDDGDSGGGSSGGGSGSDDSAEADQVYTVNGQPSADGSIGFAVSDSDGAGNILLSLTDEADDATEEPTGRNVDHDSLLVQPTETGTREFNMSVRQWDASTETNDSTNDRFFEGPGSSASGYVEVTHSNSDDDIEGVTFQFRVRSAYLDEHDIESEDLALYRDETGRWNELDATEVETTDTHHVFEAESPGLSLFAVGAPDSTEPTSGPDATVTTSPSVVTVGEEVTLDGSDLTNEDGEIAAYNWSVTGETLTGETLTGETVTVTADEPGEYTVELTVTNDAGETDTTVTGLTVTAGEDTSDNGLPTTTDDETPVGFAIYAIIALLVVVIVVVIAWGMRGRRSRSDIPPW